MAKKCLILGGKKEAMRELMAFTKTGLTASRALDSRDLAKGIKVRDAGTAT